MNKLTDSDPELASDTDPDPENNRYPWKYLKRENIDSSSPIKVTLGN